MSGEALQFPAHPWRRHTGRPRARSGRNRFKADLRIARILCAARRDERAWSDFAEQARYSQRVSALKDSEPESSRELREEWDRELSEFLLRVSHDMRSPMRVIRIHTELIRKDSAASDAPRVG